MELKIPQYMFYEDDVCDFCHMDDYNHFDWCPKHWMHAEDADLDDYVFNAEEIEWNDDCE